jgi:hypothetical protein
VEASPAKAPPAAKAGPAPKLVPTAKQRPGREQDKASKRAAVQQPPQQAPKKTSAGSQPKDHVKKEVNDADSYTYEYEYEEDAERARSPTRARSHRRSRPHKGNKKASNRHSRRRQASSSEDTRRSRKQHEQVNEKKQKDRAPPIGARTRTSPKLRRAERRGQRDRDSRDDSRDKERAGRPYAAPSLRPRSPDTRQPPHREAEEVRKYLHSIPKELTGKDGCSLPGKNKGIVRRMDFFTRAMARHFDTSWHAEKQHLETIATKAGYSTREFFALMVEHQSNTAPGFGKKEADGKGASSGTVPAKGKGGKGKAKQLTPKGQGRRESRGKPSSKGEGKHAPPHEDHTSAGGKSKAAKQPSTPPKASVRGKDEVKKEEEDSPSHPARSGSGSPASDRRRRRHSDSSEPGGEFPVREIRTGPVAPVHLKYSSRHFTRAEMEEHVLDGVAVRGGVEPEHAWLYRFTIFGHGRLLPSWEGKSPRAADGTVLPPGAKAYYVDSAVGTIPFPVIPEPGGFTTAHFKGWPLSFLATHRMCQVGKALVKCLRHQEHGWVKADGSASLPDIAEHLSIPMADILDTAMFSWSFKARKWRFEIIVEEADCEPAADTAAEQLKYWAAWSRTRLHIRAVEGHTIELLG